MGLVVSSLLIGRIGGNFEATVNDKIFHQNRVDEGGCLKEFTKATNECHPRENINQHINVEKCVKATAALRKCFAAKPEKFRHLYLPRMDRSEERRVGKECRL